MNRPLLAVRNTVLFPHVTLPLAAGRKFSTLALEAALARDDREVLVVAQRTEADEPGWDDIHHVATRGVLRRVGRAGEQMHVVVEGLERVELKSLAKTSPYLEAEAEPKPVDGEKDPMLMEALKRELNERLVRMIGLLRGEIAEAFEGIQQLEDPLDRAYLSAMLLGLSVAEEQELLEAATREQALKLLFKHLDREADVLALRRKIAGRAQEHMSREQREYFLREQLKAIQDELGGGKDGSSDLADRAKKTDLPEHARREVDAQLERLSRTPSLSPDYQVIRGHIELILDLPWTKRTTDNLDLDRARQILDEDHYDLQEVKDRILEHLAVMKLNPKANAPLLCFVGPPGTGKTSLGQSIARALGRAFERMSLGGLHDEAELRGHRRTYVGAMPGRFITALRRAGAANPLIMLDEIDKLGRDFRGDPAAALMEILDPAQNSTFHDNYLDLAFDLSKVFFITTANSLDGVPPPLLDRMEVLRLSGYTELEKTAIARRYLIPRQMSQAGLTGRQFSLEEEALARIIRRWTREAGLRQLERAIARCARRVAMRFAQGATEAVVLRPDGLEELLGPERFFEEEARKIVRPGVAAGLAWTPAGGEILYVESLQLPGGNALTITGNVGDVMRESVRAAWSWVVAKGMTARAKVLHREGLHVHVPAGAVPKDGPSAGAAIAAALASLYAGKAVRGDAAMTGEITLSGLLLPVGGIKEKVLAAHRAGLRAVILPKANAKDLKEVPDEVKKDLEFIFAERIDEVLAAAIPGLMHAGPSSPAVKGRSRA